MVNTWMKKLLGNKSKLLSIIILLLIILSSAFWLYHLQKRNQEIYWKRNIWADASGYFVYLPSTFIYHFSPEKYKEVFSERIDENGEMAEFGNGFRLENNKVFTKYFYGTALLQSPVYIIIHLGYKVTGTNGDGFNGLYEHTTIISSIIYFIISLVLLYKFLRKKTSQVITLTSIFFVVFATNVIYYFGAYPGYTHPYLFFLISAFLFASNNFSQNQSLKNSLLIYVIAGLILVTRPIHIITLALFFIDNDFKRLAKLLTARNLALGIAAIALIVFPQLLYYKYISGSWLYYPYGTETFTNLLNPSLIVFYFSTNNGLILYNPIWFIFLLSSFYILFTKHWKTGLIAATLFFANSYLCSSWHIWNFGCGYGSRNFVEFAPIFALPFALILNELRSRWKLFTIIALSILFCCVNFVFMYKYDKCYFGKGNWDIESLMNFFQ